MAARCVEEVPCPSLPEAALGWLAADPTPRLLVDEELRLLWCNDPAASLLAARAGLERRAGCLTTTEATQLDALRALLQSADGDEASLCLPLLRCGGWLLARARQLAGGSKPLYGLTIAIADGTHRPCYRHLDDAFGLTPSEHRVLLDMLTGNDAEALASLHGVTIETTRSHIRSIYSKLAVNSRERLFAKVQPFNMSA